jgi:hypothetical protein
VNGFFCLELQVILKLMKPLHCLFMKLDVFVKNTEPLDQALYPLFSFFLEAL